MGKGDQYDLLTQKNTKSCCSCNNRHGQSTHSSLCLMLAEESMVERNLRHFCFRYLEFQLFKGSEIFKLMLKTNKDQWFWLEPLRTWLQNPPGFYHSLCWDSKYLPNLGLCNQDSSLCALYNIIMFFFFLTAYYLKKAHQKKT